MDESLIAIFCVLGIIVLCVRAKIVKRNMMELLSPVNVVVFAFVWVYLVSYFLMDSITRLHFLDMSGYLQVLLLATLCVGAFWLGFHLAKPGQAPRYQLNPLPLKFIAVSLIVLGATGWIYFVHLSGGFLNYYGSLHGSSGVWQETTAYLYMMILLLFPGIFLLLSLSDVKRYMLFSSIVLLAAIGLLLFDAWTMGERSTWIRLALVLGGYLIFLSPRRPSGFLLAGVITMFLGVAIVTPYIRASTYLQADTTLSEALMVFKERFTGLSSEGAGNELIVASALVGAASEQGIVDFGWLWLHPWINVIPRIWWSDKPYASDFSISYDQIVWQSFGWVPGGGAAPTGLADTFIRFSWAAPFVWFTLGLFGGFLFKRARKFTEIRTVGYLVAYLFGLVYAIMQSFNAAVYAFMYMMLPLFVAFALTSFVSRFRTTARHPRLLSIR